MIQVKVEKAHAKYKKIAILGHALYDDYGKDIVCAAASSIVTTTVNGILALDKGSLSYMISKKGFTVNIKNEDSTTQILIGNMVSLLKELEKNRREEDGTLRLCTCGKRSVFRCNELFRASGRKKMFGD